MAQIIKIIEETLSAGATTLTVTDAAIPYSIIAVNCDKYGTYPANMTVSGTTLTLAYEAQTEDLHLAISLLKSDLAVIDDLTSDSQTDALSAAQGKALKALIDNIVVTGTLSGLDDVDISDLTAGDILVYDSISEKWVNAQPSIPSDITDLDDVTVSSPVNGQCLLYNNGSWENGTPSAPVIYSTTETVIGTWTNGKPLYRKCIEIASFTSDSVLIANSIYYGSFVLADYISNVDMAFLDIIHSYLGTLNTFTRTVLSAQYEKDTGNCTVFTIYSRSNVPLTLVVEYTKTTD